MSMHLIVAAFLAAFAVLPAAYAAEQTAQDQQQCRAFYEFGPPEASAHRFTGEDAAVYIDALEPSVIVPGVDTRGFDLVLVFRLSGTPFGRELGPEFGNVGDRFVAVAGREGCLIGRKFFGPIDHRNGLAMVNRRRVDKGAGSADLEQAAATGDAEALAHLGIRRELERGEGSGRDLVTRAAEMNVGLAIIALGYWSGGFDKPPRRAADPFIDRAAAYCWFSVGSMSRDRDIREFSQAQMRTLRSQMTRAERRAGEERWKRTKGHVAHPSCK